MSLSGALTKLSDALLPLFDPRQVRQLEANEPRVKGIKEAAAVWSSAMQSWTGAAGFTVLPGKGLAFEAALVNAWVTLPPQGPVLMGQAFSVFWTGNTLGAGVAAFPPTPFLPITPPPPAGATPEQLTQNLAQTIYLYTLANGTLTPPGGPFPP